MNDLGKTVRARRLSLGLSQAELAKRAGLCNGTISLIESGKHTPVLSTLSWIAEVLGMGLELKVKELIEKDASNQV